MATLVWAPRSPWALQRASAACRAGPGPTTDSLAALRAADTPKSDAHREIERRLARSPRDLLTELARTYGHDFADPTYINAIALLGRLKLGQVDAVRALAEPYVDGTKDSLARPNALTMAGHIVFTELARRDR